MRQKLAILLAACLPMAPPKALRRIKPCGFHPPAPQPNDSALRSRAAKSAVDANENNLLFSKISGCGGLSRDYNGPRTYRSV